MTKGKGRQQRRRELFAVAEDETSGGCGGYVVIAVVAAAPLLVLYGIAPEAFVLAFWAVGWGLVVWAARKRVQDAPDPAPPPVPERGSDTKPQFRVVQDPQRPGASVVVWDEPKAGTS